MKRNIITIMMFLVTISLSMSYGKQVVLSPDLSTTGIIKNDNHYYLQNSTQSKLVEIGANNASNVIGRGQLVFDLSNIPSNATINSAKLYLTSSTSTSYTFGPNILLYYATEALTTANASSWSKLDPNSDLNIANVDMKKELTTVSVETTALKTRTKSCFGGKFIINVIHNQVGQGKGLLLSVSNQNTIALVIDYTEAAVSNSLTISSGPSTLAEGARGTYTATYTGTSAPSSYTWSSNNGKLKIVSGQGTRNITVEAATGGATTDVLKVTAGGLTANKSVSITSNTVYITNETITTSRNITGTNINVTGTTIQNNATVNITATNSVILKPTTHIKQGTKVVIKVTGATRSLAPEVEDLSYEDETTSIEGSDIDIPTVYPNPVSDLLIVDLGNGADQVNFIEVYNSTGQMLTKRTVIGYQESIDVNNYTDGMYILRIVYKDGKTEIKKFMVAK